MPLMGLKGSFMYVLISNPNLMVARFEIQFREKTKLYVVRPITHLSQVLEIYMALSPYLELYNPRTYTMLHPSPESRD